MFLKEVLDQLLKELTFEEKVIFLAMEQDGNSAGLEIYGKKVFELAETDGLFLPVDAHFPEQFLYFGLAVLPEVLQNGHVPEFMSPLKRLFFKYALGLNGVRLQGARTPLLTDDLGHGLGGGRVVLRGRVEGGCWVLFVKDECLVHNVIIEYGRQGLGDWEGRSSALLSSVEKGSQGLREVTSSWMRSSKRDLRMESRWREERMWAR